MTWVLLAAQIGLFVLLWQLPADQVVEVQRTFDLRSAVVRSTWSAVAEGGMSVVTADPGRVLRLGVLPLFSHAFLDGGVVAVLVNAFFLLAFGREVEGRAGARALSLLFVGGMLAGAAAHVIWSPRDVVPAGGAAAAVSAIIGASVIRDARSSVLMAVPVVIVPVVLRLPVLVVVGAWFVLQAEPLQQLLAVGMCQPMSWPAAVVGFGAGVLLSPLCFRRQRVVDREARTARTDRRPATRPSSNRGK